MRHLRFIGVGLQILGLIFLINAGQTLTGFVIAEYVSISESMMAGLAFLLIGILINVYEQSAYFLEYDSATQKAIRRHESKLEKEAAYHTRQEEKAKHEEKKYGVIRTERFEKAIRGHPIERIERALRKLEEGKTNRARDFMAKGPLKGLYRIKVDDTARIIYEVMPGNKLRVLDFTSDHNYNRTARRLSS